MHWKRWITALVALPLLILLVLKGGSTLFAIVIAIVATIALWEYFRIVYADHSSTVPWWSSLWTYAAGAVMILTIHRHGFMAVAALLVIHFIGAALFSIFKFKADRDAPIVTVKQVFGLIYIPFFMSFAVLLYNGADGMHWVFWLLLVVAAGDTGAYYVGSYRGRRKLCPAVSPKKTIEGSVGGLTANLIFGAAYKLIFLPSVSLPGCLLFALLIGAVGQAGDLFESEFKRAAGIKDSGKLLPGHGGFLDRIDALLFALPIAYLIKEYLLI